MSVAETVGGGETGPGRLGLMGDVADCRACAENAAAELGGDPWAVARLRTGVVRLNPTQYHRGATFFVARSCVVELQDLDRETRALHLEEMAQVAEAVVRWVRPRKMNYEALGNSVPHLHWWLTPRHTDDPGPGRAVWEDPDFLRALGRDDGQPSPDECDRLRGELLTELDAVGATIERGYT
jgi:diadenosine tetraphosphate (Ap4A) HIT family hydrolase